MIDSWTHIDRLPSPLRSQVVTKLRTAIMEGVFKPGDRLVERALCERLQVSRPLIREAIRQFEAEGLVEVVPNRGPVVRALTSAEAADLFDVCALIEGLCGRYFAQRGTSAEITQYEAALDALDKALHAGNRDAIRRAKNAYYEAFIAGSHSEAIQNTVRQLKARLSFFWSSSLRNPERIAAGLAEMRAIVKAIKGRDPETAYAASVTYAQHAAAYVLGLLHEDQIALQAEVGRKKRAQR